MKRIDFLRQLKEFFQTDNLSEVKNTNEVRALKELLFTKNALTDPILKGYTSANIYYENDMPYLELHYRNGKAKVTVDAMEVYYNGEFNADFSIRKLSDYDNTLGRYKYRSKTDTLEYDVCSRDKHGISNLQGSIELDSYGTEFISGGSKHYDYSLLENNLKQYDMKALPISVVYNVLSNTKLAFEPSYEENVKVINGNIIDAETKVNVDDHYLFKKGKINYNINLETPDIKTRIKK